MSKKTPLGKLSRRMQRLEDKQRRDMAALKRDLISAIMHAAAPKAKP